MQNFTRILLIGICALPSLMVAQGVGAAEPPVNIIFDTDMGGDCDDVGALFILHGAVERGEAKLLATMGCTSSEAIAPCLDAINMWFGRPEIPVGTLKDPGLLANPGYPGEIIRNFPHKFPSSEDYPDAVALYRQILARQPDGSVVVVAVGPLRNLANLLKSRPDAASPLDGPSLIAKKVKTLSVMGGKYPPFESKNDQDGEWNFAQDAPSAALVCATWPTPVLFNGEGGSTCSGRRVTYEMPEHNPLTMAYKNYPGVGFAGDRLSWDPISCLVTVRGATPWYQVVSGGVNVADPRTGSNKWQAGADRGHAYLVLLSRKAEVEKALEDLMVAGRGHPANLKFNTAYYADSGMCHITGKGERTNQGEWLDKAATSWIQCQYGEGRKNLVTSYAVVCKEMQRLPANLSLSGSNDGGVTWTLLDTQKNPGFTAETPRREFSIAKPAKCNIYRLDVTATNAEEGIQIESLELNEWINSRSEVAVASVTLDQTTVTLPAHTRTTLNAAIAPQETYEREVGWVSSDPAIAEVCKIGEQNAIVVGKQPGRCTVTASIGKVRQTCAVTVTASTLPADWNYDEIGAPPIPGSVSAEDGKVTLTGCGHAISSWWERVRDQGVFVSRAVSGATQLSARLMNLSPNVGGPAYPRDSRAPTASGLMIREALTEKCGRFFLVQVEATGNLVCRWRDKTGDQDDNQRRDLGKVSLPIHLKLAQQGGQIQVFTSTDGRSWGEPKFTHETSFDDRSRVGLFVCSGNTFASATAVFDSILNF